MKAVLFVLAVAVLCGFGVATTAAENQPSRVRDNLDGTLTDTTTGLMWIHDYKKVAKNIHEAKTICAELQYAGHKDWRLPTSAELSQFVKYLRSSKPAVDFVVLKEMDKGALYWTSSEHIQDPKKQGGLDFWPILDTFAMLPLKTGFKYSEPIIGPPLSAMAR